MFEIPGILMSQTCDMIVQISLFTHSIFLSISFQLPYLSLETKYTTLGKVSRDSSETFTRSSTVPSPHYFSTEHLHDLHLSVQTDPNLLEPPLQIKRYTLLPVHITKKFQFRAYFSLYIYNNPSVNKKSEKSGRNKDEIYPIPSIFQELSIILQNERPLDKMVEKEKDSEMSLHPNWHLKVNYLVRVPAATASVSSFRDAISIVAVSARNSRIINSKDCS